MYEMVQCSRNVWAAPAVRFPMRYFFDLKNGDGGYVDRSGVDLPDGDMAAEHGRSVAAELIRNHERQARHWRINVRDESGSVIAVIRFLAQDLTLAHLRPALWKTMEEISLRRFALGEAMDAARLIRRQSRALVARSRRKPHLVCYEGEIL
jgi:hypothetical protein